MSSFMPEEGSMQEGWHADLQEEWDNWKLGNANL